MEKKIGIDGKKNKIEEEEKLKKEREGSLKGRWEIEHQRLERENDTEGSMKGEEGRSMRKKEERKREIKTKMWKKEERLKEEVENLRRGRRKR